MQRPWIVVGNRKDTGYFANWGLSEYTVDNMGSLVIKGRTVGGISFKEIASFIAGALKKVTPPFATALLGI